MGDAKRLFSGAMVVSEPVKAPDPITPVGARNLTRRIKRNLVNAYKDLTEAYDRQAWKVLNPPYASWGAYLQAEFGDLRVVKLSVDERQDLVRICREQGMSYREIARQLGISVGAAYNADPDGRKRDDVQAERVTPVADGPTDPAPDVDVRPDAPTAVTETDNVVELTSARGKHFIDLVIAKVRAAGPNGVTCADLKRDMKVGHQRLSPTLTRAVDSRRLVYCEPPKRGQHGRYVWMDPALFGEDEDAPRFEGASGD